jgi:glycosyltransferase involved in cell wall biosynthesis
MKGLPISVVMSVFNGQSFLAEAVESILGQSFDNFEFVIIDDGSTDQTSEILHRYAARDARIRIHRHDNMGRTQSLNVGIRIASGKYIARMDADDISLPKRFQEQFSFMEGHPDVGLLGGAFQLISEDGSLLDAIRYPTRDTEIRSAMRVENPICHPSAFLRKELVLAVGGYRKPFVESEDYDLWLRISERSQLANLETYVLQYRIHPNQASIKSMRHQKECVLAARAAAGLRSLGLPDPLSQIEEINPELLEGLGVTKEMLEEHVLGGYYYWINILEKAYPQEALRAIDQVLDQRDSRRLERSEVADMYVRAAGIYYRNGRLAKAIQSGGRAALANPMIVRRLVKRAFKKFFLTRAL